LRNSKYSNPTKMELIRASYSVNLQSRTRRTSFEQWFRFLDIVEVMLERNGIKFARLDGTMTHEKRSLALTHFKTKPEVNVILISLKAGGCGLNLCEACRMFILDPWWNVSTSTSPRLTLSF
jgi:SNF2 family DNA or RNA helicase